MSQYNTFMSVRNYLERISKLEVASNTSLAIRTLLSICSEHFNQYLTLQYTHTHKKELMAWCNPSLCVSGRQHVVPVLSLLSLPVCPPLTLNKPTHAVYCDTFPSVWVACCFSLMPACQHVRLNMFAIVVLWQRLLEEWNRYVWEVQTIGCSILRKTVICDFVSVTGLHEVVFELM